jgi:hypothetical protein
VFRGQKKSGAAAPHFKISARPAVALCEGGCYPCNSWSILFRSEGGDDFSKRGIAAQRVPERQQQRLRYQSSSNAL